MILPVANAPNAQPSGTRRCRRRRTPGLEGLADVDGVAGAEAHAGAVDGARAGLDGAAVDDDRRAVVSNRCHETARHVFVASAQMSDAGPDG